MPSLAHKLRCPFFFLYFSCKYSHFIFVGSGEEEEEPAANVLAPMSTSNTVVLSEARRATEETSPPQHQDLKMSTPAVSPRAPSPKRPRIELGEIHNFVAGSSTTPPLDDVSLFLRMPVSFVEFFPSEPICRLSFYSL
jgi:hypothetical protein